jgi:DNA-binding GntR family transcriptional regulator
MPPKIVGLQDATQYGVEPRLYMQVAEVVRRRIDCGHLKPGDTVSITDLRKEYGISRQTGGKGLSLLCKEGRLKLWPGHGYTVQRASR